MISKLGVAWFSVKIERAFAISVYLVENKFSCFSCSWIIGEGEASINLGVGISIGACWLRYLCVHIRYACFGRLIGKLIFPMAQFSDNLAAIALSLRMFGRTVERINKKLIIYSVWNLNERGEEHYLEKYHKLSRICDDNWFMSFCSGNKSSGCALFENTDLISNLFERPLVYRGNVQGNIRLFFYLLLFRVKLIPFIILILLILRYCSFYR